jgi:hypothetical protein
LYSPAGAFKRKNVAPLEDAALLFCPPGMSCPVCAGSADQLVNDTPGTIRLEPSAFTSCTLLT